MIATRQRIEQLANKRGLVFARLTTTELQGLVAEIEAMPEPSSAPFPPVQPQPPRACDLPPDIHHVGLTVSAMSVASAIRYGGPPCFF
jgi:hypothetical protein